MTRVVFRISHLIRERGMTQKQFADLAEISLSHLRNIEYGQKMPSMWTLMRIARVLDCSIKDLFYEE